MTPVYACVFGLGLAARRGLGGIATVVTALAPRAEPSSGHAHCVAAFVWPHYSIFPQGGVMNLQFAPDWPVRCEFKFIMSLPSLGPRKSATGVAESRFWGNRT